MTTLPMLYIFLIMLLRGTLFLLGVESLWRAMVDSIFVTISWLFSSQSLVLADGAQFFSDLFGSVPLCVLLKESLAVIIILAPAAAATSLSPPISPSTLKLVVLAVFSLSFSSNVSIEMTSLELGLSCLAESSTLDSTVLKRRVVCPGYVPRVFWLFVLVTGLNEMLISEWKICCRGRIFVTIFPMCGS